MVASSKSQLPVSGDIRGTSEVEPIALSRAERRMLASRLEKRKDNLYSALKTHDVRYDGLVFNAVKSTKIYCRTSCRVAAPRYDNCTFFETAAQAEACGYRPCLMCRPELAPGVPVSIISQSRELRVAAVLQEWCTEGVSLEAASKKAGITPAVSRLEFIERLGVTPEQHLLTCRLHLAKSLISDCDASLNLVAQAAGFQNEKCLCQTFTSHYRLDPSRVRRGSRKRFAAGSTLAIRLGYRPPFDFSQLLSFFASRAIAGVESVDAASYTRTVRMPLTDENELRGWIRVTDDPRHNALLLEMSESLAPAFSRIASRVRHQFDLDCDPQAVFDNLAQLDESTPGARIPGTRIPGCFDPFETTVRAILGQQVSIAAANTFAARIAETYGTPLTTTITGLGMTFPSASQIAAMGDIESDLGTLGVIKTRSRTIQAIARAIESGALLLGTGVDAEFQMNHLLAVKGIGPWSANYIAMRTMNYPDAFLESDVGIRDALPGTTPAQRKKMAEAWSPWRSYANVSLWNRGAKRDM